MDIEEMITLKNYRALQNPNFCIWEYRPMRFFLNIFIIKSQTYTHSDVQTLDESIDALSTFFIFNKSFFHYYRDLSTICARYDSYCNDHIDAFKTYKLYILLKYLN